MKRGDQVATTTGIAGTVSRVEGHVVWIKTAYGEFGMEADEIERPGKAAARRRQELRRSSAAVPIPAAKHKRPRSAARQALREEIR